MVGKAANELADDSKVSQVQGYVGLVLGGRLPSLEQSESRRPPEQQIVVNFIRRTLTSVFRILSRTVRDLHCLPRVFLGSRLPGAD